MKRGLKPFLALNEGILFAVVGRLFGPSLSLSITHFFHTQTHTHTYIYSKRRQDFVRTIKCDLSCLLSLVVLRNK